MVKNINRKEGGAMVGPNLKSIPLFSSKNIIMLLIRPEDGLILDANKGAIDFYGYSLEEIKGMSIQDINILPQDEIEDEMRRAKEEQRNYFLFRHRKANGTIASVEVHSEPIEIEGEKVLFSIIQDITQHNKLMANYVDVLQRYQTVFNHVGDMIFLIKVDADYHPLGFIEVNKRALEVLKYSEEEMLDSSVHNLINLGVSEQFSQVESELKQSGTSSFYMDTISKYGETVPLYINTTLMEYSGETVIVAVARDLSVEFELQMDRDIQLNYYHSLFSKSPNNIFLIDSDNKIMDYNPSVVRNFHLDQEILVGRSIVESLEGIYLNKGKVETVLNKGWQENGIKDVVSGLTDDGTAFYMEIIMMPFDLPEGSKRSYVMLNNITHTLEETHKLDLLSEIFAKNNEGIIVTNSDKKIEWVNKSFEEITGFTYDDVIEQSPSMLKSNNHDLVFYEELWTQVKEHGAWTGEVWNRKKTGELYPVQLNIFTVEDQVHKQLQYIGILSDLAKIKEQEEKIFELIYVDSLTQLRNRTYFMDTLKNKIEEDMDVSKVFSIIYIDIDNFKVINDRLGHSVGDEVLSYFAKALRNIFGETCLVGRIGGDEFTVLVDRVDQGYIDDLLSQLDTYLSVPFKVRDGEIELKFSAGIAQYPHQGKSSKKLLINADLAMYKAKEVLGNRFEYYDSGYSRI